MISMHIPRAVVKIKMKKNGLDPNILDLDLTSPSPNQPPPLNLSHVGPNSPASSFTMLKDDPKFSKYFKMLSMHLPKAAVAMKMTVEGVDPSVLDLDSNSPSPNQPSSSSTSLTLKDDPKFSKYFKMLSMHLPKAAVAMKMTVEGVDPSVLDLDPNSPSPDQPQSTLMIHSNESTGVAAASSSNSSLVVKIKVVPYYTHILPAVLVLDKRLTTEHLAALVDMVGYFFR
jgi:hypothetical protein